MQVFDPVEQSRSIDRCPVLVGRTRELATIVEHIAIRPSTTIVTGEPGIGKTRLVQEVVEVMGESVTVLEGRCLPFKDNVPLAPVMEAIRDLDIGALPGGEKHARYRALVELLEAIGDALLVLEDIHWADETTFEFIGFLMSHLPPGLAVLITYRDSDLREAHGSLGNFLTNGPRPQWVKLEPLDRDEVGTMVGALLDAEEVSEEFSAFLSEKTGGLPFAIEEVVKLLLERDEIVLADGRWNRVVLDELTVPGAVREFVIARLEALPQEAHDVASAHAVIGGPARLRLLSAVAQLSDDETARALGALAAASLVEFDDEGRSQFRHSLTEQAIYEEIVVPRRALLHAQAAEAMSPPTRHNASQLAHHFGRAGIVDSHVLCSEMAAEAAVAAGNDIAALQHITGALAHSDLSNETRIRLTLKLGWCATATVDLAPVIQALQEVIQTHELTGAERGELLYLLGRLQMRAGDWAEASSSMHGAAAEKETPPEIAALAMIGVSHPSSQQGSVTETLYWLDEAEKVAHSLEPGEVSLKLVTNRAYLRVWIADPGAWDAIDALPWDAQDGMTKRQIALACVNLADAGQWMGFLARSHQLALEGVARAEALGNAGMAHSAKGTCLTLDLLSGRWQGLSDRAKDYLVRAPELRGGQSEAHLVLGVLMEEAGQLKRAHQHFSRSLEVAKAAPLLGIEPCAIAGLARLETQAGVDGDAVQEAGSVFRSLVERGFAPVAWATFLAVVESELARGRVAAAGDAIGSYSESLVDREAPLAQAVLSLALGLHARHNHQGFDALFHFETAAKAFEHIEAVPLQARSLEHLGELAVASDLPEKGIPSLIRAFDLYTSSAMTRSADRVRQSLRAAGHHTPSRRGRRSYGMELSPSETRVIDLARLGRTNREIGEQLFISPKTVEKQLAGGLKKLGLTSKRDLLT